MSSEIEPEERPADTLSPEVPPAPAEPSAQKDTSPSFGSELLARRVPQILGLYLGGATSAVLFVEFLVGRYALSPYLVDALLLALVLAVPAVAVLAYAHGAPGAQRWTRRQMLAVAANGVVGMGVLAAAFWGKPLGATTETVSIETAEGEVIQRQVAQAAFRRRLVVADFGGDEALGRAAGYALAADLDQDLFVSAFDARSLRRAIKQAGFETVAGAPVALLRDAAEDRQFDQLLTGRVEVTPQGFRVEASLHAPGGPARPTTYTAEGASLPRLLDDVSARVRADLGLPEVHLAQSDDQLIEDHLSGSTDALSAWAAGYHAQGFLDDQDAAVRHFQAAVDLDTTFARAFGNLGFTLATLARESEALTALAAAQRHRYRLPEPKRFGLDAFVARLEQRPDDALAIVRDWAALFPDDTQALETLLGLQVLRDDLDGAIATAQQLAALDAGNPIRTFSLAKLYFQDERLDEAREAAETYIAQVPEDPAGLSMLAGIVWQQGDIDEALELSRQAIRLDPADLRYASSLAAYQMLAGSWDEAEAGFKRIADRAPEASDRAYALNRLAHLYDAQGRYQDAAQTLDAYWTVYESYSPTVNVLYGKVGEGYHYTRAGRTDVFEQALAQALSTPEAAQSSEYRGAVSASAAWAYAQIGRSAEVFRYTRIADSLYRAYGREESLPYVRAVRGMGHANQGDYARAISAMEPHAEKTPTDYFRMLPLAHAYLAAGDEAKARETAETILISFPAHPGAHLVLAKVKRGAEAREHLDQALAGWTQADPEFEPAREARALRQRVAS